MMAGRKNADVHSPWNKEKLFISWNKEKLFISITSKICFIYFFFDKVTGVECAKHKSDVQSLEHTEI